MNYWLIKTEPDCFSIDDLKRKKVEPWSGVRNYQARNFMKEMKVGDLALFYHSSCDEIGVAGVAKVVAAAHPDLTALDPKDDHYDPKATKEKPIWECADFGFVSKFPRTVTLAEIKNHPKLAGIGVAQTGSRLSVRPVSKAHFDIIVALAAKVILKE
jgi:predicted RNA-binding protein with PUA-like domain